jgi:hypothetical protein
MARSTCESRSLHSPPVFEWFVVRRWWGVVYDILFGGCAFVDLCIQKRGSAEVKAQWDALLLPSHFGWRQGVNDSSLVARCVPLRQFLSGCKRARCCVVRLASARPTAVTRKLELFKIQRDSEREIASLEMQIPPIHVRPLIKVGKDPLDLLREEIERKKGI